MQQEFLDIFSYDELRHALIRKLRANISYFSDVPEAEHIVDKYSILLLLLTEERDRK